MIDFHTHILPGIDDGANSTECSFEMLELLKKQGVDTVVATPHFYGDRELSADFVVRRNEAVKSLLKAGEQTGKVFSNVIVGAEVALTSETSKDENLEKLCIGNSNAILLELPYSGYSEWIPYAVYEIISRRRLVPVLAHLERFVKNVKSFEQFESLLSLELYVQVNADSFLDRQTYKIVKHMVKNNMIDILGSDAHNMNERRSNFLDATKKIEKKFGKDYLLKLDSNARKILKI